MADPRLDAVLAAIRADIATRFDDDPRDYEAEWEMRHDPEADLDRMEDRYEASLDATH